MTVRAYPHPRRTLLVMISWQTPERLGSLHCTDVLQVHGLPTLQASKENSKGHIYDPKCPISKYSLGGPQFTLSSHTRLHLPPYSFQELHIPLFKMKLHMLYPANFTFNYVTINSHHWESLFVVGDEIIVTWRRLSDESLFLGLLIYWILRAPRHHLVFPCCYQRSPIISSTMRIRTTWILSLGSFSFWRYEESVISFHRGASSAAKQQGLWLPSTAALTVERRPPTAEAESLGLVGSGGEGISPWSVRSRSTDGAINFEKNKSNLSQWEPEHRIDIDTTSDINIEIYGRTSGRIFVQNFDWCRIDIDSMFRFWLEFPPTSLWHPRTDEISNFFYDIPFLKGFKPMKSSWAFKNSRLNHTHAFSVTLIKQKCTSYTYEKWKLEPKVTLFRCVLSGYTSQKCNDKCEV